MIFQLQCGVRDLGASCKNELEEVFSRLVDADWAGRHFFVLRRELCAWAVENLALSGRNQKHLVAIGEQYATRGGLLESAGGFVSVVMGDSGVEIRGEHGFAIGHRALIEGEYLLRSTGLVVEDVEIDGRIYKYVLNEARRVSGGPSYSFDPIHGGGSATVRVFESEIEKNRIVVCIVDHDRLAPMDKASSTARKVLRAHRRRNTGSDCAKRYIGMAVTTIGREAENIVPYQALKAVCQEYEHFDKLDEVFAREHGDADTEKNFWQYFDIKKGIDGEKMQGKFNNGSISEETYCWVSNKLGCASDEIQWVVVGGFGENVLQRFLENPDALKRFHAFTRTDCWRDRFGGYFNKLLWFFAAPVRTRT